MHCFGTFSFLKHPDFQRRVRPAIGRDPETGKACGYDVILSFADVPGRMIKCVLSDKAAELVELGKVATGTILTLNRWFTFRDMLDGGHGNLIVYLCDVSVATLHTGDLLGTALSASTTSWYPCASKRWKELVPLVHGYDFYLPLTNDDCLVDAALSSPLLLHNADTHRALVQKCYDTPPRESIAWVDNDDKLLCVHDSTFKVRDAIEGENCCVGVVVSKTKIYIHRTGAQMCDRLPLRFQFEVADCTGSIQVVVWNSACFDYFSGVQIGSVVVVENARLKKSRTGKPELSVNRTGKYNISTLLPEQYSDLPQGQLDVTNAWSCPSASVSEVSEIGICTEVSVCGIVTYVGYRFNYTEPKSGILQEARWIKVIDHTFSTCGKCLVILLHTNSDMRTFESISVGQKVFISNLNVSQTLLDSCFPLSITCTSTHLTNILIGFDSINKIKGQGLQSVDDFLHWDSDREKMDGELNDNIEMWLHFKDFPQPLCQRYLPLRLWMIDDKPWNNDKSLHVIDASNFRQSVKVGESRFVRIAAVLESVRWKRSEDTAILSLGAPPDLHVPSNWPSEKVRIERNHLYFKRSENFKEYVWSMFPPYDTTHSKKDLRRGLQKKVNGRVLCFRVQYYRTRTRVSEVIARVHSIFDPKMC